MTSQQSTSTTIRYSIIVPTYRRGAWMTSLVTTLAQQVDKEAEIIVVSDGKGVDPCIQDVEFYIVEHGGAAKARNFGVSKAQGHWLVFLDDDVTVDRGWYNALKEELIANESIDIMWGAIRYEVKDPYFPMRIVNNPRAHWPMSAHMMVKKNIFLNIGGFSPEYGKYHNEDTEFVIRAKEMGCSYRRLPYISVTHRKDDWTGETLLASAQNGAVWPLLKKEYPNTWNTFQISTLGPLLFPVEYHYILFYPLLVGPLFIRYLFLNRNNPYSGFVIFFIKWPLFFILRRLWIWKSYIVVCFFKK